MQGHWLMSCYACGGRLRYPSRLATDPIHGERVSVCSNVCAGFLRSLGRRMDKLAGHMDGARLENEESSDGSD